MRGARIAIIVGIALLLSIVVLRSALVRAYVRNPDRIAGIAGEHPDVIFGTGLAEAGRRAAAGQPVDDVAKRVIEAAAKAPLAPEPFLARGVQARVAGNEALAGRAFVEARRRNPRSPAARYFLADHYLRTGQSRLGLGEISVLTLLVPVNLPTLAPYLAAYARSPGGAAEVGSVLERHPQLEPILLETLAGDSKDATLALRLWRGRGGERHRAWQSLLLETLVKAGRFDEAGAAWRRFEKRDGAVLNQLDFTAKALPPFGWTLASGAAGVAEPTAPRQLHLLYYGRDDAVLASRMFMFGPGNYRLSMQVSGNSPGATAIAWTIHCIPSGTQLLRMVPAASGKAPAAQFTVPANGCGAQRLELAATAPEFPQQIELTIADLAIDRGGGR